MMSDTKSRGLKPLFGVRKDKPKPDSFSQEETFVVSNKFLRVGLTTVLIHEKVLELEED